MDGAKLTYDDFLLFPDDGKRHEFRRSGDTFQRPQELSAEAGDVLTTPLLPGLTIELARIFD